MPNNDRTGPEGKGPRTGRSLGDCNDSDDTRRGLFGRRQGLGRGNRDGNGYGARNGGRGRGWRLFGRRRND